MASPVFAVVGHPNKGKSSIVSTLAHDGSVAVGSVPGTTIRCREYPMRVDGETQYVLVDTPGFQRPRGVLAWLKRQESNAVKRPRAVRKFLEIHTAEKTYPDECELLRPIMSGAGILYVVDGSKPYLAEYEAEMEILRWTGQPRMALINPIGSADHIQDWKAALGQYFNIVKVFNALMADFDKQLELLRSLELLDDAWQPSLHQAIEVLQASRRRRRSLAAHAIAEMLVEMLTFKVERKLDLDAQTGDVKTELFRRYQKALEKCERRCREHVEEIYEQTGIQRREPAIKMLGETQLLSDESWRLFGLSRKQLLAAGATGGGTMGVALDVAASGISFGVFTVLGAGLGAAGSYFGARQLAKVKILNTTLGHKFAIVGPAQNINFPYVALQRARLHHALVANRAHARRDELKLETVMEDRLPPLPESLRKRFDKTFSDLRQGLNLVRSVAALARDLEELLDHG